MTSCPRHAIAGTRSHRLLAASPGWRRSSRGLYVPASADGSRPEQRIVEQAAQLPVGGAVTGWAACRLHGAAFFDGLLPDGRTRLPVPLVTNGRHLRGSSDVALVRDRIDDSEIVIRHGVPIPRIERALYDAMRCRPVREAVVAVMHAARERARPAGQRAWTVVAPPWWETPRTLDQVLDQRDVLRSLHLAG